MILRLKFYFISPKIPWIFKIYLWIKKKESACPLSAFDYEAGLLYTGDKIIKEIIESRIFTQRLKKRLRRKSEQRTLMHLKCFWFPGIFQKINMKENIQCKSQKIVSISLSYCKNNVHLSKYRILFFHFPFEWLPYLSC